MAIAAHYPVKIVSHKWHKGLAAARNTAFKTAKNEFVAALDADCIISENWLEELMKEFTDNSIAGVGGKLVALKEYGIADKWRERHMAQHWGEERMENPRFLYGSNNVYRKSRIMLAGLYNEIFTNNYEDCDISKRLLQNGFKLIYSPSAKAMHLRKDSLRSVFTSYHNWCFYERPRPETLGNFFRKTKENIGLFGYFFRQDIRNKDYILAGMDAISLFYHTWLDIKYYIKHIFIRNE